MLKMEINSDTPATATPTTTTATASPSPSSSPPQPSSPSQTQTQAQPAVVLSPCAACKILRRRCAEKCVLAPYFPPTEPAKFTIAHRVFGASNIIKFLQELPESQRADAVSSMVYEAGARIRDPVYGCAGAICQLQRQVSELQAQLAKAQAELVNMQLQQANLLALLCNINDQPQQHQQHHQQQLSFESSGDEFISSPDEESNEMEMEMGFLEDNNPYPNNISANSSSMSSLWGPFWA